MSRSSAQVRTPASAEASDADTNVPTESVSSASSSKVTARESGRRLMITSIPWSRSSGSSQRARMRAARAERIASRGQLRISGRACHHCPPTASVATRVSASGGIVWAISASMARAQTLIRSSGRASPLVSNQAARATRRSFPASPSITIGTCRNAIPRRSGSDERSASTISAATLENCPASPWARRSSGRGEYAVQSTNGRYAPRSSLAGLRRWEEL